MCVYEWSGMCTMLRCVIVVVVVVVVVLRPSPLLRGAIVNTTYGTHIKPIHHISLVFAKNSWSYLRWSPVTTVSGPSCVRCGGTQGECDRYQAARKRVHR